MGFNRVGVIAKQNSSNYRGLYEKVFGLLNAYETEIVLTDYISTLFPDSYQKKDIADFPESVDLCIVFGGDGTFLYASRILYGYSVPLTGVNLGRLGFLTEIPAEKACSALKEILEGNYVLENRYMLKGSITKNNKLIHENYALNDIVITNKAVARVIELDCHINNLPLTTYVADGIIISTGTGSSAYALSVGGPLMNPKVKALLIAPISPHSLTHRPLVIPEDSVITVPLPGSKKGLIVTVDGQVAHILEEDAELTVVTSPKPLQIIHAKSRNYYDILKEKLNWGIGNAY